MSHGYSSLASISAARGRDALDGDLADQVAEVLVLLGDVVDVGSAIVLMGDEAYSSGVHPAPWASEPPSSSSPPARSSATRSPTRSAGVDLTTVGLILMIVGILGLILSLFLMLAPRRSETVVTRDDRYVGPAAARTEPPLGRFRPVRLASAIRPATDREVPLAVDVLRRAGFGTQVARLLEYPRRSPDGAILVAEGAGSGVVGVACTRRPSAPTGWIGALGVAPEARRGGLGTALTEAAVRWLRARGAATVLLYATEAGRPVYERLGLRRRGARDRLARRGGRGARRWTSSASADADRARLRALDHAVTGERRDAVLDAIHPLAGVGAPAAPHGLDGLGDRLALGRGHRDRRAARPRPASR